MKRKKQNKTNPHKKKRLCLFRSQAGDNVGINTGDIQNRKAAEPA